MILGFILLYLTFTLAFTLASLMAHEFEGRLSTHFLEGSVLVGLIFTFIALVVFSLNLIFN